MNFRLREMCYNFTYIREIIWEDKIKTLSYKSLRWITNTRELLVLYKSPEQHRHIKIGCKFWGFNSNFMLNISKEG